VLSACERFGLGMLPFFPLASGLLTGKYRQGEPAPAGGRLSEQQYAGRLTGARWDTIDALRSFAEKRGLDLLDVAIGGLAAKPAVASVIAGATKPEQVAANVAAAQWIPSEDDLAELNAIG
jgi:aryl-alcohol dehydrogenase-like predicted oxidoreductase